MLSAVDFERLPVPDGAVGKSSIQNGRKLETPCFVTSRKEYEPTGVFGGTSILARSLAASFVLLASIGKPTFAGKSVTRETGSFRFVPVSVTSTVVPGLAPNGFGKLIVGACGSGGITKAGG